MIIDNRIRSATRLPLTTRPNYTYICYIILYDYDLSQITVYIHTSIKEARFIYYLAQYQITHWIVGTLLHFKKSWIGLLGWVGLKFIPWSRISWQAGLKHSMIVLKFPLPPWLSNYLSYKSFRFGFSQFFMVGPGFVIC